MGVVDRGSSRVGVRAGVVIAALLLAALMSAVLPARALASPMGSLTQPAGAAGCVTATAVGTCATDALDSGFGLSSARAVTAYGGYVLVGGTMSDGNSGIVVLKASSSGLTPVSCASSSGDSGHCSTVAALADGAGGIGDLVMSPDGQHLYATEGYAEIVNLGFNAATGALSPVSGADGCVSDNSATGCQLVPSTLQPGGSFAISADGQYAYSTGFDAVFSYSIGADGGLTALSCASGTGDCPANDGLTNVTLPLATISGATPSLTGLTLASNATTDFVFVVDSADSALWQLTTTGGVLALPDAGSRPSAGCIEDAASGTAEMCASSSIGLHGLTGGIAFDPVHGSPYLYLVGQSPDHQGIVSVFTDTLGFVGCSSVDGIAGSGGQSCGGDVSLASGGGLYYASDPVISADGASLYVASGNGAFDSDTGAVAEFAVDPSSGALTFGGCYTDGLVAPASQEGTCTTTQASGSGPSLQGLDGIDYFGQAQGALALNPAGAATVGASGSELYVPAQTDNGVAVLTRVPSTTQYTVTGAVGQGGGGTVTASSGATTCPSATCTVSPGATVTLTAVPAAGYRLVKWSGGTCDGQTSATCTISGVGASETDTAVFDQNLPPGISDLKVTHDPGDDHHVTITATIDPHGFDTSASVQFGTDASYGHSVGAPSVPASGGPQVVTFSLTGLNAGTPYHYQVLASSSAGSSASADALFATGGAPPPPPPQVTAVSAPLTGLTSVQIDATLKGLPYQGQSISVWVDYGTTKSYGHSTPGHQLSYDYSGAVGYIQSLQPGTRYDYEVVVTSNLTGQSTSQNLTFTTPPPGPDVTTQLATDISDQGATLNGTIDDKDVTTRYTFFWSATFHGPAGCDSGQTITGQVTGTVLPKPYTQTVSQLLTQPLPVGSEVTYHLVAGTPSGFAVGSAGSQSFVTGDVPVAAEIGVAYVQSATSAQLAAVIPSFNEVNPGGNGGIIPDGTTPSGGIQFTGIGTAEYGLFSYTDPADRVQGNTGASQLWSPCGTYVLQSLTGLFPDTTYHFAPEQAYGVGQCPYVSDGAGGNIYQYAVSLNGGDWCWNDFDPSMLACYFNWCWGANPNGTNYWTWAPVWPTYVGPVLTDANFPDAGNPVDQTWLPHAGATQAFTTGSTTAPGDPTVNPGTGAVSDTLGCAASTTCSGTQKVLYATHAPQGSAAAVTARASSVVLGSVTFRIPAHRHKTVRLRIGRPGLRFLHTHPKVHAVWLITVERAGKHRPVTLSQLVKLAAVTRGGTSRRHHR